MKTLLTPEASPAEEPASLRRGRLESAGFRYQEGAAIFVHRKHKTVLTEEFVECCHRDDLRRAMTPEGRGWAIHSAAALTRRSQAALLRAARRAR